MSKEVKRYTASVIIPGCLGPVRRDVVMDEDYDSLLAERDRLRDALVFARKEAIYGLRHAKNHLQAAAALGRITEGADTALQGEQP